MKKLDLTNLKHELKEVKNIKEKNLILSLENEDVLNLTESEEINNKIKQKALEFINVVVKSTLYYGKHLTEVFEILSNDNKKDGSNYLKYLAYIGINERTARRYRKRYKIFKLCKSDYSKEFILKLSDKEIQFIDDNNDKLNILEEIENKNLEKTELIELINLENEDNLIESKIEINNTNLKEFFIKIDTIQEKMIPEKIKNLKEKDLLKLNDYIDKIEKLLK